MTLSYLTNWASQDKKIVPTGGTEQAWHVVLPASQKHEKSVKIYPSQQHQTTMAWTARSQSRPCSLLISVDRGAVRLPFPLFDNTFIACIYGCAYALYLVIPIGQICRWRVICSDSTSGFCIRNRLLVIGQTRITRRRLLNGYPFLIFPATSYGCFVRVLVIMRRISRVVP